MIEALVLKAENVAFIKKPSGSDFIAAEEKHLSF
jgi:hypothetical protein